MVKSPDEVPERAAGAAGAEEPPKQKKPSKKKQIIATIVTIVLLIVIFVGIGNSLGGFDEAFERIGDMATSDLLLLGLAALINLMVYPTPYLASTPGLAYWPAFNVRQTSFMISNVVPLGGAFGLATQYAMLGSYGVGAGATTATIGVVGTWNILVTLGLPALAGILLVIGGASNTQAFVAAGIGLVVIVVMVGGLYLILRSEELARRIGNLLDNIVNWFLRLIRKEPTSNLTKVVLDFRTSTIDVVGTRWLSITGTSFLQQLAQFAILYVAVLALQGDAPDQVTLIETFAAFSFGRLASFIPITPGGIGMVDAAMASILMAFGMGNSDALAAVMVWRLFYWLPQVVVGVITLLVWGRTKGRDAVIEMDEA
jgi:uncharacterized protein (TIRG00374 family)